MKKFIQKPVSYRLTNDTIPNLEICYTYVFKMICLIYRSWYIHNTCINETTYYLIILGIKTQKNSVVARHAELTKFELNLIISKLAHIIRSRNRLPHVCQTVNRFSSSAYKTRVYSRCDSRPYRKAHKRKEAPSFRCWSNKRRGIISRIYDFRNTSANAEFPRRWKVSLDLSPDPLSFPFLFNARSYPAQNPYPAITKLSRDSGWREQIK